jgi:hypothetical protein
MEWKSKIGCLALCIALCGATTASADVVVGFTPSEITVDVGDIFDVDLFMTANPELVSGWGLDVEQTLTMGLVQLGSPVIGPDWTPVFAPDGDELAGLAAFGVDGVTGTSTLATLTYQAVTPGVTVLYGTSDWPDDETEGLAIFGGGVYNPDATCCMIVNVIPEPASLALLLIGGLALRRRR